MAATRAASYGVDFNNRPLATARTLGAAFTTLVTYTRARIIGKNKATVDQPPLLELV